MGAPSFRAFCARVGHRIALFPLLALLAAARLGSGLLRLVAAVVPFVVGHGLGNLFGGQLAAAQMQYIVGDCRFGFGWFHGFLLFKVGARLLIGYSRYSG